MNLRDALLAGLASVPGTREFHLHVLVSSPRKHGSLFPFANPRPRTYLQDILILLSEQGAGLDSPRVFVSAIEACVYNIPATSCAILYISKVDSTGQAAAPSPTAALVRSLLLFYAEPATRPISCDHVWIHLFARAQNQYLFPNSSEYANKRPLSDVRLCAWWKRQISEVAGRLGDGHRTKLYYVLPGLSEFEAFRLLERIYPSTATVSWTYGHPYGESEIPLPCACGGDARHRHLGQCIPSFGDDPKSRFMDEIAYTTEEDGVRTCERKRARTGEEKAGEGSDRREGRSKREDQTQKEVRKVSVEEFWERMSFRQECMGGAVAGFFVMAVSASTTGEGSPQAGEVSSQMNKRILTSLLTGHEFPSTEKAAWSTRVVEDCIRGLCDGLTCRAKPGRSGRGTPEGDAPQTPPRGLAGKAGKADAESSPGPFGEPVACLETYHSHIYGSVAVKTPGPPPKDCDGSAPGIRVLTARKKRTK